MCFCLFCFFVALLFQGQPKEGKLLEVRERVERQRLLAPTCCFQPLDQQENTPSGLGEYWHLWKIIWFIRNNSIQNPVFDDWASLIREWKEDQTQRKKAGCRHQFTINEHDSFPRGDPLAPLIFLKARSQDLNVQPVFGLEIFGDSNVFFQSMVFTVDFMAKQFQQKSGASTGSKNINAATHRSKVWCQQDFHCIARVQLFSNGFNRRSLQLKQKIKPKNMVWLWTSM